MTYAPIAQLRSDWFKLSDLDRARAVLAIKESGFSIRKIAAQLQLSESLLRHLLLTLQASASDQALARQGKITTNELARRGKATLRPIETHEALTIHRDREIRIAADLISDWVSNTQLFGPARKMIVEDVQRKFRLMKEGWWRLSGAAPPGTPAARIIERTRPAPDDRVDIVGWFVQWLCRWSFFAFPDEDIRDNALALALQMQSGK